jgi:hypothetical protein
MNAMGYAWAWYCAIPSYPVQDGPQDNSRAGRELYHPLRSLGAQPCLPRIPPPLVCCGSSAFRLI